MGGLGSNINLNLNLDGPASGMGFGSGLGSGGTIPGPKPVSPPQPTTSHPRPAPPNAPKRQDSASEKGKEKAKSGDRTAHNDIERKYRTNLKDKIAELRDAVPALRAIPEEGGPDDGSRPPRPAKVSKVRVTVECRETQTAVGGWLLTQLQGTVLTKATEYIHHLERRNKQIMQQHRELSRRLQAFEQLLSATARSSYAMPTYSRTLFDPRGFC
jgi:hypothetical protein